MNEKLNMTIIITCFYVSPSALKTYTFLSLRNVFDNIVILQFTNYLLCGDFNNFISKKQNIF